LLGRAQLVTPEQLATLKEEAANSKRPLLDLVFDRRITDERTLVKAFAEETGIPYIEIDPRNVDKETLNKIPERVARQYMAVLFKIDQDGMHHLAMEDPDDVQAVNFIQKEIGTDSTIYIATHDNILSVMDLYRGDVNKELNKVIEGQRSAADTEAAATAAANNDDISEDSPIAQTVNLLLEYAIHSHGNPTLNLTNISGTTASASNGLTLSLSAAAQSVQTQSNIQGVIASGSTNRTGDISFANSNGVTFGLSNNTITASVAAGGGGGVALYDGANSISSGTARISAGGALTASINGQTLSLSAPAQSSLSGTGIISISRNANTISIGAPAFSAGMSNIGNTQGTTGTVSNQIIFAGGNNITLSQSTGAGGNILSIAAARQIGIIKHCPCIRQCIASCRKLIRSVKPRYRNG
jgi:type IV pilus assembly protein PilB